MHDSAKLWLGNETFDTYLSQPRITSTTSDRPRADVLELEHIVQITAVDGVICENLKHAKKNSSTQTRFFRLIRMPFAIKGPPKFLH